MRRLLRVGTSRPEASTSALKTSAETPTSGIIFVDNSCGASAATAELSAALDNALDQVNLSGDLDGQLRDILPRLDREASKYDNSRVDEDLYTKWTCSQPRAHVISAVWKCALGAYDTVTGPANSPYYNFEQDRVVSPSIGGSTKALLSTIVTPAVGTENSLLPALVIAVRGSASKVDHMVNANSRPRVAFNCNGRSIAAHSGFVNSAEALENVVSERIRLYVQSCRSKDAHIIFTGHSAGGAVASLLFLRRFLGSDRDSETRLSCITFGAPPVVTQALDVDGLAAGRPLGLCLNIINEFDVVSRADRPYILSLVNLMRSLYGQPPILDDAEVTKDTKTLRSKPADQAAGSENVWPLPPPMYHHVGTRVLLLTRLDEDGRICLKACEVPGDEFQQLMFCRVEVHRRACYAERIQRLEREELNRLGDA